MNTSNVFEVVQSLSDGDYFVAVIDGDAGVIVARACTNQPVNWLELFRKAGAEYIRYRRRGVSPTSAAFAAREAVTACGPSTTRFIDRVAEVEFPPLP